ncbi:MAG: MFS transporter [Carbonactinosporaceae bacterium]
MDIPNGQTRTRGRRRQQRGWYVYDWGASAFSTTVITVFLGPYLTDVAQRAAGPDQLIHPLGIPVRAGSFFPYAISASVVLSVLLLPIVGGIADRTRAKRTLLACWSYVGAAATMGLYLVDGDRYLLGGVLLVIANVAFSLAVAIYHSFLPEIATPDERDAVSSRGWAAGYLGGGLLLAANLAVFQSHASFGLSAGDAARISMLSAGAWWALFTAVPLAALRPGPPAPPIIPGTSLLGAGFQQLTGTLREARGFPVTLAFLGAFLLYNDGIQTVIALATVYGSEELGLAQSTLITAVLMVQFLAFAGALLLGRIARTFGAKPTVLATLVAWTAAVALGYALPAEQPVLFYVLAAAIGLVLGGSQALSRSLFSQLIPVGKEAEYFSLYEISDRGTSWIGTLLFGLTFQLTGSYRAAIVSLVVFFVLGFIALLMVPVRRGIAEVGNVSPQKV